MSQNQNRCKFLVVKGLPRTGKTLLAMNFLQDMPNAVRISKDDIREMIHKGLGWKGKLEQIAVKMENHLISDAIIAGRDVIIDDTNLNNAHVARYRDIAEMSSYEFQVWETKEDIDTIIERDKKHVKKLGSDRIIDIAFKNKMIVQQKEYVIYSLETLANSCTRRHLALTCDGSLNMDVWYEPYLVEKDMLDVKIRTSLLNDYDTGHEIILISGRPEKLRRVTEDWLKSQWTPYNRLIMRPDNNKDLEAKYRSEVIKELIELMGKGLCVKIVDKDEYVISQSRTLLDASAH